MDRAPAGLLTAVPYLYEPVLTRSLVLAGLADGHLDNTRPRRSPGSPTAVLEDLAD